MVVTKNSYYCLLFIFSLFAQIVYGEETDTIYKYENSDGVTEFTDTVKPDHEPDDQIQFDKMTDKEKAQSQATLDQIIKQDRALDMQVEAEKALEDAQKTLNQKERELKKELAELKEQLKNKMEENESNSSSYNNNYGQGIPAGPIGHGPIPGPR